MRKALTPLQTAFLETMARVCTPVSVVTALGDHGPHGTTVSAFASLSMAPPMLLVSLDHSSELLAIVSRSRRFGVNVLDSTQSAHAAAFARKGPGSSADFGWELDAGVPRIPGASAFLACDVAGLVEAGDHTIVLGAVTRAESSGEGKPLTYYSRTFATHVPHREPARVPQ